MRCMFMKVSLKLNTTRLDAKNKTLSSNTFYAVLAPVGFTYGFYILNVYFFAFYANADSLAY